MHFSDTSLGKMSCIFCSPLPSKTVQVYHIISPLKQYYILNNTLCQLKYRHSVLSVVKCLTMIRLVQRFKLLDCFHNNPVFAKKDRQVDMYTELTSIQCGFNELEQHKDHRGTGLLFSIVALSLNRCYERYFNTRAKLFK